MSNRNQRNPRKNNSNMDSNNPVVISFKEYAMELDHKHDRHERIVKLSRDITIESKRIIFLLHSIDSLKDKKKILSDAEERLKKLIETHFRAVAKELIGQDVYQFRKAYSPGLQEFVEAFTFMEYLKCEDQENGLASMSDWKTIQQNMQYEEIQNQHTEANEELMSEEKKPIKFDFFVDPSEYMLGLCDLTGELMRRCVNSLGSGETDTCLVTCKVLQQIYSGFIRLNCPRARELWRKLTTMRQSVLKAENVCYNVKVRGSEAAKWGAVCDMKPTDDVDEGFY